jgi:hypothetical protein
MEPHHSLSPETDAVLGRSKPSSAPEIDIRMDRIASCDATPLAASAASNSKHGVAGSR